IAHVCGFLSGVARGGIAVHLIGPPGIERVIDFPGVKLSPVPVGGMISGFFWNRKLVETVSTVAREQPDSVCYVRYAARFSPYVSCLARRLHGIPLLLEVNSFGAQRHRWMRTFDKHAMKAAHRVVVVST